MPQNSLIHRHNVHFLGPDPTETSRSTLILAHGFGCDQQIWGAVVPMLVEKYPVVLFDHMGCGQSDLSAYEADRYSELSGYADDLIAMVQGLNLEGSILVSHSISSAIGWLASLKAPQLFRQIIAIGPSPCYINDPPDYIGGFEARDVQEMIDLMERNHFEWAGYLAPIVMGDSNRPAIAEKLRQTFLNADPVISRRFAQTTFNTDIRHVLPKVPVPSLILYCEQDVIVPLEVIDYFKRNLSNCTIKKLDASGHYPHMSSPAEVSRAVLDSVEHAN